MNRMTSRRRHVLSYWKFRFFSIDLNSIPLDRWWKPLIFLIALAIALAIVIGLGMNVDNLLLR